MYSKQVVVAPRPRNSKLSSKYTIVLRIELHTPTIVMSKE